eukprot:3690022-Amphidinium_carterae.1
MQWRSYRLRLWRTCVRWVAMHLQRNLMIRGYQASSRTVWHCSGLDLYELDLWFVDIPKFPPHPLISQEMTTIGIHSTRKDFCFGKLGVLEICPKRTKRVNNLLYKYVVKQHKHVRRNARVESRILRLANTKMIGP